MSRSSADNLVYMANQIARNLAAQGEQQAAAATAEHILLYWDERMRSILCGADTAELHPIAARAIAIIRQGEPGQQAAPAMSLSGGSDAG